MSKNKMSILLEKISETEIAAIVDRLGKAKLTPKGHDFEKYGCSGILEAAQQSTLNYTKLSQRNPALGLVSVVLAANREYNTRVLPNIAAIELAIPSLISFKQLKELMHDPEAFYKLWGHRDAKKYRTLEDILRAIEEIRLRYVSEENEFNLLHRWASEVELLHKSNDPIGSITNVGIATFQHLRMVFGVDTVKPDQRVKEVLRHEFKLGRISDAAAIQIVEEIAQVLNMKVILVDQVFVKYGSSYYNNKKRPKIRVIAKRLKELDVATDIISDATGLSISTIKKL